MSLGKKSTRFAFDFTRADRVVWSYGRSNGEVKVDGTPAGFFVNDAEIADHFARVLEPVMADQVDIAVALHTADRLALRTAERGGNWSRHLDVTVCVRRPEIWTDPLVKGRLERLLAFLTEDVWKLAFVLRRDSLRRSEIQDHLPFAGSCQDDVEVGMFSGGLDSFAGTASWISESERHFILVSASPNPQQRFRQQRQVKILRDELGRHISHVCVPYGIHRGDEYAQEPSRRTRGLLFLILGGVTALSAGSSALYLYENGLGAVNLPYDQSQLGTDNARAVHPRVLREISELLSLVAGKRFSILNRCIYQTKAEMLEHPGFVRVARRAIPLTFSCDGFPVRTKGHAQCGFCTSCLLRRYSLEIAGLGNLDLDGYLQDWKSNSFRPTRHHLRGLRAMDWQVLRLEKSLAEKEPWRAVTVEFPELRALVNDLCLVHKETSTQVEARLMRVLGRHVADWPNFSALQLLNANCREVA